MEAQGLKFSKKGKLSNQAEHFQIIPQKEMPQTCLRINSLSDTNLLCIGSSDHKKTRKTLPVYEQEQPPHLEEQER